MKKSKDVFDEPKGRIKVIIYLRHPRHLLIQFEQTFQSLFIVGEGGITIATCREDRQET